MSRYFLQQDQEVITNRAIIRNVRRRELKENGQGILRIVLLCVMMKNVGKRQNERIHGPRLNFRF